MPTIFQQLETVAGKLREILDVYDLVDEGHQFSWPNFVYTSPIFRRAHLDIVDVRDTKKLYMLHLTVFPHRDDPAPIFGFDIIAGANKVTGAFHDFSPVNSTHPLLNWFEAATEGLKWSKKRELPEWAKAIFSEDMIAAGNIQDEAELAQMLRLVVDNLLFYLDNIGGPSGRDYTAMQNFYCQQQKKNPHTPRVMASLGLDPDEVKLFIETCLFPEVEERFGVIDMLAAYGESK